MWLLAYYAGLVNRPLLQLIPPLFISTNLVLLRLFWANSGESGTIDGDIMVIVVMNAIGVLLVWYRNETRVRGAQLWNAERRVRVAREGAGGTETTARHHSYLRTLQEVRTSVGTGKHSRYTFVHTLTQISRTVSVRNAR